MHLKRKKSWIFQKPGFSAIKRKHTAAAAAAWKTTSLRWKRKLASTLFRSTVRNSYSSDKYMLVPGTLCAFWMVQNHLWNRRGLYSRDSLGAWTPNYSAFLLAVSRVYAYTRWLLRVYPDFVWRVTCWSMWCNAIVQEMLEFEFLKPLKPTQWPVFLDFLDYDNSHDDGIFYASKRNRARPCAWRHLTLQFDLETEWTHGVSLIWHLWDVYTPPSLYNIREWEWSLNDIQYCAKLRCL